MFAFSLKASPHIHTCIHTQSDMLYLCMFMLGQVGVTLCHIAHEDSALPSCPLGACIIITYAFVGRLSWLFRSETRNHIDPNV